VATGFSTAHQAALDRIVSMIDDRSDQILEFASEFVRQPSVNPELDPNPDAERPATEWLRQQLDGAKAFDKVDYWEVEPNRGNVVATRAGRGRGRSLIWVSHNDVVPVNAEQRSVWDGDPFSGEIRDGRLWGRGAADMKGPSAAQAMAGIILHDAGVKLNGDLTLAHTCGEESGRYWLGCNAVLDRGYSADLAIFPECSDFSIFHVGKGEIYFRLTVPGKSTHICNRHLVAHLLPHGEERPGVSAIDNMLKYQLAFLELERNWGLWYTNPLLPPGGQFISINSIHAGTVAASVPDSNIPDICVATGSMLFYPHFQAEDVIAEVKGVVDRVTESDPWLRSHPPTLEIPFGHPHKEALNMPADHPGIEVISTAMERLTGKPAPLGVAPAVGDCNYWFAAGQPSLWFGPGSDIGGVHGANEYISTADIIEATKAFAAVTMEWCGVAD
jgi:acetylornithine deacetylase/succinyl-diaminopimelate desuccinylase-like protein